FHLSPGAAGFPEVYTVSDLAFASQRLADLLELLRQALIGSDDLVEGVGNLAGESHSVARHPHREVTDTHGLKAMQQVTQNRVGPAIETVRNGLDGQRVEGAIRCRLFIRLGDRGHGSLLDEPKSGPKQCGGKWRCGRSLCGAPRNRACK